MIRIHLTLCVGLLGNFLQTSHAQSIADLTEQLILDEQKLASMKATLQEMYNGYTRLEKGYTDIRNIAQDNFNLHKVFLDAMLMISPFVSSDPRVTDILKAEGNIIARCGSAASHWAGSGTFSPQELDYIVSTYSALLDWCQQSIRELALLLTDGELRMTDADRLSAIGRIEADAKDQQAILLELNNTLSVQAALRLKEQGDIQTLKLLYGFPN